MSPTTSAAYAIEPSPDGILAGRIGQKHTERFRSLEEARGALGRGPAVVALPRRSLFVRTMRVPNASKADVRAAVATQLGLLLPLDPADIAFDFHLTDDVNTEGRLATVFALNAQQLEELKASLAAADIEVSGFVPSCLGSMVLASQLRVPDCLVISQSAAGLGFDVIRGGEITYAREAPTVAEEDSLRGEIARTLAAASESDLPIVMADGLALPSAEFQSNESPLVDLASHEAQRMHVSLESPRALMEREKAKRAAKTRFTVLLCAAAAVMWTWVFLNDSDVNRAARQSEARFAASLRTLNSAVTAAEARLLEKTKLKTTLDRAFAPKQAIEDVLAVVSNHTNDGVWLTNFSAEFGKPLEVRGTALTNDDVSTFVADLEGDQRFRDVRLLFANNGTIEERHVVQFAVQAHVIGNLPIVDPKKGGK